MGNKPGRQENDGLGPLPASRALRRANQRADEDLVPGGGSGEVSNPWQSYDALEVSLRLARQRLCLAMVVHYRPELGSAPLPHLDEDEPLLVAPSPRVPERDYAGGDESDEGPSPNSPPRTPLRPPSAAAGSASGVSASRREKLLAVIRRVAAERPIPWSGRYEGAWMMTLPTADGESEGEATSLAGSSAGATRRQYAESEYRYCIVCDSAAFEIRPVLPSERATAAAAYEVRGELEWQLLATPKKAPNAKHVGKVAKELVTGSISRRFDCLQVPCCRVCC